MLKAEQNDTGVKTVESFALEKSLSPVHYYYYHLIIIIIVTHFMQLDVWPHAHQPFPFLRHMSSVVVGCKGSVAADDAIANGGNASRGGAE